MGKCHSYRVGGDTRWHSNRCGSRLYDSLHHMTQVLEDKVCNGGTVDNNIPGVFFFSKIY